MQLKLILDVRLPPKASEPLIQCLFPTGESFTWSLLPNEDDASIPPRLSPWSHPPLLRHPLALAHTQSLSPRLGHA